MPLSYRNRQMIIEKYPELGEALDDITGNVQSVMTQTNSSPTGQTPAPPAPSSLTVTAAQGIFDAAIQDNNPVNRGINYFLEYSEEPGFSTPKVIDLGASRNHRVYFGNRNLYWRAYSAYPTSGRSSPVYHGSAPTPIMVNGGGVSSGPNFLGSQGSGTTNGPTGSDGGFGNNPYRKIRPTS